MAVELNDERTMNPLVNAGAIATTSLVPGDTAEEKWARIRDGLSRFAGRELSHDEDVYASESATNLRNHGIAHLLESYGRLYFDPDEATDVYTRQCSLDVTVHDLAVMAATLADGGVNPVTGERVIGRGVCRRVLAVMATAGLYELSGDWLYEIGLPGQERRQRRHRDRLARQGRPGDVLATARRRRQQRARPAGHEVPVRAARPQPLRLRGRCGRRRPGAIAGALHPGQVAVTPCLPRKARAVSATSGQPWSMTREWPRPAISVISVAVACGLLLVRRVGDRPRHGVVLLARDDQQRTSVGPQGVDGRLGPRG